MRKKTRIKQAKFSDQIRQAIDASEFSRYRIANEIEISQALMSRFMSGERGLSMESLDALAEFLGLRITIEKKIVKRKD